MFVRKLGKTLLGKSTPFHLIVSCVAGALLAFAAPFVQAPAYWLVLVALICVLPVNLFLATLMGPGWEAETATALHRNVAEALRQNLRPGCDIHPNRLLVWLGDRALNRQGLLWNALVRTMPGDYTFGFRPPEG